MYEKRWKDSRTLKMSFNATNKCVPSEMSVNAVVLLKLSLYKYRYILFINKLYILDLIVFI